MRKIRKNCKAYNCICGQVIFGKRNYYEHRKCCNEYLKWRSGAGERSRKTRQEKLEKMSNEEKEALRKKMSESQKRAWSSPERRKIASERTVFNNFWKYRSKNPIIYESSICGKVKLDSNWELLVAKRLDELNVEWYRPRIRLPYLDNNGVEHGYFPDFYVKTYNCFIEVKSPFVAKWQNSQNKVSYIKEHYKFVMWLESEDDCRFFELQDLKCRFIPEKDEDDISYWIERYESIKREKKEKRERKKKHKKESEDLEKEQYRLIIEKSNIDFSKFGWVGELSKLLNRSSGYIRKHIPPMFPEIEFFTRAGENSNANKHWWTNGIEEVTAVNCPEGWWNGRIAHN